MSGDASQNKERLKAAIKLKAELKRKKAELEKKLRHAEIIIEAQRKLYKTLTPPPDESKKDTDD